MFLPSSQAVTFHELFKEAALDANSRMDFGVEWQEIFSSLQSECDVDFSTEYLREKFEAIDDDGSGELDEQELRALFNSMGRSVSKRVISNLMRLSDLDGNGTIDFEEVRVFTVDYMEINLEVSHPFCLFAT